MTTGYDEEGSAEDDQGEHPAWQDETEEPVPIKWADRNGRKRSGWRNKAQTVMWHVAKGEIEKAQYLAKKWGCHVKA